MAVPVRLLGDNGMYVCAEGGGDTLLLARTPPADVGTWEILQAELDPTATLPWTGVTIKVANGKLVRLAKDIDGNEYLVADADGSAGAPPAEKFTVVAVDANLNILPNYKKAPGTRIALQAESTNHYVSVEKRAAGKLMVNRTILSAWELFEPEVLTGP